MSTFRGQETRCSAEPVINAGQETVMFKKGINMIPGLGFRCFGILIVGLAGLMSAACFAAEPAGGKKFSLVYLVGVEEAELKPGVAAFVEPMFFTDGKELVLVY